MKSSKVFHAELGFFFCVLNIISFYIMQLKCKTSISLNSECWNLKDVSTSIPSGANINDYTTVGRYKVQNSATAASITNGPTTADGYLLMVMELVNTSSLLYLAITNRPTPVIYFRRSAYSSSTWSFGEWQKITTSAVS